MDAMNFQGIENLETAHGTVYRCEECGSTVTPSEHAAGKLIRHTRRCDSQAQPYSPAAATASVADRLDQPAVRAAIRQGAISAVLTDDEIVDGYRAGRISASDAMNRDF